MKKCWKIRTKQIKYKQNGKKAMKGGDGYTSLKYSPFFAISLGYIQYLGEFFKPGSIEARVTGHAHNKTFWIDETRKQLVYRNFRLHAGGIMGIRTVQMEGNFNTTEGEKLTDFHKLKNWISPIIRKTWTLGAFPALNDNLSVKFYREVACHSGFKYHISLNKRPGVYLRLRLKRRTC